MIPQILFAWKDLLLTIVDISIIISIFPISKMVNKSGNFSQIVVGGTRETAKHAQMGSIQNQEICDFLSVLPTFLPNLLPS